MPTLISAFFYHPEWDVSPSQGYPEHLIQEYPFLTWQGEALRIECLVYNTKSSEYNRPAMHESIELTVT